MTAQVETEWRSMFPHIDSPQALGRDFKRRRVEQGLSIREVSLCIGKSDIWVRGVERWPDGYRPYANCLYVYMRFLGFTTGEVLLCMAVFDLFPSSLAGIEIFHRAIMHEALCGA